MLNTYIPTTTEGGSIGPARFIKVRVSDLRQTTTKVEKWKWWISLHHILMNKMKHCTMEWMNETTEDNQYICVKHMSISGRENLSNKCPTCAISSNFTTRLISCPTMASTARFMSSFLIPPVCSRHGQHAQKEVRQITQIVIALEFEIKISSPIVESTWSRAHQNRHGQGITAKRPHPSCQRLNKLRQNCLLGSWLVDWDGWLHRLPNLCEA